MINSCVAINCTNRHVKGKGVKFHKFPLENKELCLKWVAATKGGLSQLITAIYVGDHFIAADYLIYFIILY